MDIFLLGDALHELRGASASPSTPLATAVTEPGRNNNWQTPQKNCKLISVK